MAKFTSVVVGEVSYDINIDCYGNEDRELGGAVVQSAYAAANLGHTICAAIKAAPDTDVEAAFADSRQIMLHVQPSTHTTSIKNVYHTADKERRTCTAIGRIDPYSIADLPDIEAHIWHLAGLMHGDIPDVLIPELAQRGKCALDVQGVLRHVLPDGSMQLKDWEVKRDFLPHISYLKTDTAEAETLTGSTNRYKAAEQIISWGADEVMITHNSEVLVYDGDAMVTFPLKPRNLSGRSGRGDTCFASYITQRLTYCVRDSLLTAAALVSLKMESPGPFKGTKEDVANYIEEFYKE